MQDNNQDIIIPSNTKRNNLLGMTTNWVKRSKFSYAVTDFTVSEEKREITCHHKDHKKAVNTKIVLSKDGYWNISNFTRHVMVSIKTKEIVFEVYYIIKMLHDFHKEHKPLAEKTRENISKTVAVVSSSSDEDSDRDNHKFKSNGNQDGNISNSDAEVGKVKQILHIVIVISHTIMFFSGSNCFSPGNHITGSRSWKYL
jgi:hypothetical protein